MNELDCRIVNRLQRGFPLCPHPFRQVAKELEIEESLLIRRLRALLEDGTLTRFGPLFNAERLGGELGLAAMQVPEERFEAVAEEVNSFAEVAHNYQRDHVLNLWFVIAAESQQRKRSVLQRIEQSTSLAVYDFPRLREYYIGLYFEARSS